MNWLLFLLLLFTVFMVVQGAKRGFVRSALSIVFFILVFGLASFLHPYVSDFLLEHTGLYEKLAETGSELISEGLESEELSLTMQVQIIDELPVPGGVKDGLLKNNNAAAYQELAVQSFSDYVAAYLARLLVRGVAFLLAFIVAWILVRLGMRMADLLSMLPGISILNRIGGGILGFFQAVLWIYILFAVVTLLRHTELGGLVYMAIENNAFLSDLYNGNILWYLLSGLMG